MSERNFLTERLIERIRELRRQYQDDDQPFFVETSKVLLSVARNERKRREAESLLKLMKTAGRFDLFDR